MVGWETEGEEPIVISLADKNYITSEATYMDLLKISVL